MKTMNLPVVPPLEPMLAKAQAKVPIDDGVWSYEPKWDGFLHWTCQRWAEAPAVWKDREGFTGQELTEPGSPRRCCANP